MGNLLQELGIFAKIINFMPGTSACLEKEKTFGKGFYISLYISCSLVSFSFTEQKSTVTFTCGQSVILIMQNIQERGLIWG